MRREGRRALAGAGLQPRRCPAPQVLVSPRGGAEAPRRLKPALQRTIVLALLLAVPALAQNFENSPSVHELIRAGNLYLSLEDALALAIENNLDVELQRYQFATANTERLR